MSPEEFRAIVREEVRAVVREEIATGEARITSNFQAAIAEAEARITANFQAAIAEAEARSQGFARDIETKLLTAFDGHAKAQTARLHTVDVTLADLAARLAALED